MSKMSIYFDLFHLAFDINGPNSNQIVTMIKSDGWNWIKNFDQKRFESDLTQILALGRLNFISLVLLTNFVLLFCS